MPKEPQKKRKRRMPGQLVALNELAADKKAANIALAWDLRTQGKTIKQIAEALGVSEVTAKDNLNRGREAAREHYTATALDHTQTILAELESIISKWRPLCDMPHVEGADRAAALVIRALEDKAKLLGLEGKGAGLVTLPTDTSTGIDLTEALRSPAARDALRAALAQADAEEQQAKTKGAPNTD